MGVEKEQVGCKLGYIHRHAFAQKPCRTSIKATKGMRFSLMHKSI